MKRTLVTSDILSAPAGSLSRKSRSFSFRGVTWPFGRPGLLHGVGLAGGLSGGLLGIGGGSVMAPLLLSTGRLRPAQVSGTTLATVLLISLVIVSSLMGRSAAMVFSSIELLSLSAGLVLIVPVLLDGESNWLEGVQLLACYAILGIVLWSL